MSDRNENGSNASSYDSMFNGSLNNGEGGDNCNNFNWIIFIIIFFLIIRKESCFNFLNGCFRQQSCHDHHQNDGCNSLGFNGNGNILWIFGILVVLWLLRGNCAEKICDDGKQSDGKCDDEDQNEDNCDEEISDEGNCDVESPDDDECDEEISDDDECDEEISDDDECDEEISDEEDCDEDDTTDDDCDEDDSDEEDPAEEDCKCKSGDLKTEAEFC